MKKLNKILGSIALSGIASLAAAATTAPLMAEWKFDEGQGNQVFDTSPMRYKPGTVHGAEWCEGLSGKALHFNGVDQYVRLPEAGSDGPVDGITIAFDFCPERLGGEMQWILGGDHLFFRIVGNSLNIEMSGNAGWKQANIAAELQTNQWYHAVLSFDCATKKGVIYLNNKRIGDISASDAIVSSNMPLLIGAGVGLDKWFYQGKVDEIQVYHRALSESEIIPAPPGSAERAALAEKIAALDAQFEMRRHFGDGALPEVEFGVLRAQIEALRAGYPGNAAQVEALLKKLEPLVKLDLMQAVPESVNWTQIDPLDGRRILPDTPLAKIDGMRNQPLCIVAAPGEFESAGLVISAAGELKNLTLTISDLKCEKSVIAAGCWDAKLVKCWLQNGAAWTVGTIQGKRTEPTPELLLHDPDFLTRPFAEDKNAPDVEKIDLSHPAEIDYFPVWGQPKITTPKMFPIADAPKLLPVNIPAGKNQQFHLTLALPRETPAGLYTGSIAMQSANGIAACLPVRVRVLPYVLPEAGCACNPDEIFTVSVYYWGQPTDAKAVESSKLFRTDHQLAAEMRDMAEHGITSPILTWNGVLMFHRHDLLKKGLKMMQECNMGKHGIYFGMSGATMSQKPEDLATLERKTREMVAVIRSLGFTAPIHIYGRDEAKGEEILRQRKAVEIIHQAGARVIVSGFNDLFANMGDLLDVCNRYGFPSAKDADEWHSKGKKIWCYGSPFAGNDDADIYRRNYGLMLWQLNYDGFSTYCYYNPDTESMVNYLNFVYPTSNGVIDTLAWEGYREAGDDIRYATKLLKLALAKQNTPDKAAAAKSAVEYLRNTPFQNANLTAVRLEIIRRTLELESN